MIEIDFESVVLLGVFVVIGIVTYWLIQRLFKKNDKLALIPLVGVLMFGIAAYDTLKSDERIGQSWLFWASVLLVVLGVFVDPIMKWLKRRQRENKKRNESAHESEAAPEPTVGD